MRRLLLIGLMTLCLSYPAWADPKNVYTNAETPVSARCVTADGLSYESCSGSGGGVAGTNSYAVKRTNIAQSSVNLAFGFSSLKVAIELPLTNTDDVCIDWLGGTAVCPSVNTAGDDRYAPGSSIILDNFSGTSISVISASGTQTVYVRAW